jgi:hypothetical protein
MQLVETSTIIKIRRDIKTAGEPYACRL